MKKTLSVAAVILALIMVFSLAACGQKTDNKPADTAKATEAAADTKTDTKTDDKTDTKTGSSDDAAILKEYLESDMLQKEKESAQKALESQMDVDFKADGTTMVITYTLKQEFLDTSFPDGLTDAIKETIKTNMDEYLSSQGDTVKPMIEELKDKGISDPSIRIVVLGPDGYEYASKAY